MDQEKSEPQDDLAKLQPATSIDTLSPAVEDDDRGLVEAYAPFLLSFTFDTSKAIPDSAHILRAGAKFSLAILVLSSIGFAVSLAVKNVPGFFFLGAILLPWYLAFHWAISMVVFTLAAQRRKGRVHPFRAALFGVMAFITSSFVGIGLVLFLAFIGVGIFYGYAKNATLSVEQLQLSANAGSVAPIVVCCIYALVACILNYKLIKQADLAAGATAPVWRSALPAVAIGLFNAISPILLTAKQSGPVPVHMVSAIWYVIAVAQSLAFVIMYKCLLGMTGGSNDETPQKSLT